MAIIVNTATATVVNGFTVILLLWSVEMRPIGFGKRPADETNRRRADGA
jgi:hypothetical protein